MRKAQMEMIGLVFVVVILVLGVVLFIKFKSISGGTSGDYIRQAAETQQASAFMTSLKETSVPACSTTVERVARACLEDDYFICPSNPCVELQNIFETITNGTLTKQGILYNLSLEGSEVMAMKSCNSSDTRVLLSSAQRAEVILSGGSGVGHIRLSVCR